VSPSGTKGLAPVQHQVKAMSFDEVTLIEDIDFQLSLAFDTAQFQFDRERFLVD
jgi:hypothetical protein